MENQAAARSMRAKIVAAYAAIYVVWGSTYLFIKFAVTSLPPYGMAGVRFLVAGGILYAILRKKTGERPQRTAWWAALMSGTLLLVGGNGLVSWAEQTVPSGLAALLVATVPMWVMLIDWIWYRETVGWRGIAGLVMGGAGVYLLVDPGTELSGDAVPFAGAAALVLASLSWAAGSVYSRRAPRPRSSLLGGSMQMLAGGAALLLVATLNGEAGRFFAGGYAATSGSLLALGYLIVFGTILALSAYLWLLQQTSAAKVATYAFVNPAIAVFLGWAFAGEALDTRTVAALVLVTSAVVLVLSARTSSKAAASAAERVPAPDPCCPPPEDEIAPIAAGESPAEPAEVSPTSGTS